MNERYCEIAGLYLERFPIGSDEYRPTVFDKWGWKLKNEYRLDDLRSTDKEHTWGVGHAGWGTHLQNRHRLKERINKGGRSPEFFEEERFQVGVSYLSGTGESNDIRWRTIPLFNEAINRSKGLAAKNKNYLMRQNKYVTHLLACAEDGELHETERALLLGCKREMGYQERTLIAASNIVDDRIRDSVQEIRARVILDRNNGKPVPVRLMEALGLNPTRRISNKS